jgi:hypothetical protein
MSPNNMPVAGVSRDSGFLETPSTGIRSRKLALLGFLLLLVSDILERAQYIPSLPKIAFFGFIVSSIRYCSLFLLLFIFVRMSRSIRRDMPKLAYTAFCLWAIWCVFLLVYGFFRATDYWEWKFLFADSVLRYSVHFAIAFGIYTLAFREIYVFCVRYLFLLSPLLIFLSGGKGEYLYSYAVMPVTLLILAVPYVKQKERIAILLVAFCSIIFALYFRSNVIRISFGIVFALLFYFRGSISVGVLKVTVICALIAPFIFVYLGLTSQYNPFQALSSVEATRYNSLGQEEDFAADTRTFLYEETLQTLSKRNSYLIGEGGAGSYESIFNFDFLLDQRRFGTEVGFLNVILHGGVVGVLLYFVVLSLASYYGVFVSKNWFSKSLGAALACRWCVFFIEDPTAFDMNMFFLWLGIGLSFSKAVRSMSDKEIRQLFRPVFR